MPGSVLKHQTSPSPYTISRKKCGLPISCLLSSPTNAFWRILSTRWALATSKGLLGQDGKGILTSLLTQLSNWWTRSLGFSMSLQNIEPKQIASLKTREQPKPRTKYKRTNETPTTFFSLPRELRQQILLLSYQHITYNFWQWKMEMGIMEDNAMGCCFAEHGRATHWRLQLHREEGESGFEPVGRCLRGRNLRKRYWWLVDLPLEAGMFESGGEGWEMKRGSLKGS